MPVSDLREQIQHLENLLSADPDNVQVRQRLLRCQRRLLAEQGPDPEVVAAFDANIEVLYALSPRDPLVSDVLAARLGLVAEVAAPSDAEAAQALAAGVGFLDTPDLPAAQEPLQRALLAEPDSPAVHAALVRYWLAVGAPTAALGHAEFLRRSQPESPVVLTHCGEVAMALGRHRAALNDLLHALALNPLYVRAEHGLVALGEQFGYRWLRLPLHPGVWPVIAADGQHWLAAASGLPSGVRAAWKGWAREVLRRCQQLPLEAAPLAGLPRDLSLLQDVHAELLHVWRVRRCLRRWWQPLQPTEVVLDWLAGVAAAGLLDAYLFYAYLHPALATDYRAWRTRDPGAMERFLRDWVIRWTPVAETQA